MSEHIPIFCATDENYAPFTSMMMKSLLAHTKSFVDFYVMDGGIKTKTKSLIKKDLKQFSNKKIHYVDMSKYDLSRFPNLGHFSVNTFARYFVPEIAPDFKKVIYMDVDIIVKQDIQELFDQDMNGHEIAGTPCDFNEISMTTQIKRIYPEANIESVCFSAGMLLMDIPKLRKMNYTANAIRLTETLYKRLCYPDQDVLNIIFENNFKHLDYRFDFIHTTLAKIQKTRPEIRTIDPLMIHYTLKPWKSNVAFQEDFEEELKKTVFQKIIQKKWRSRRVKYYLFGFIPVFKKYVPKDIFMNQFWVD